LLTIKFHQEQKAEAFTMHKTKTQGNPYTEISLLEEVWNMVSTGTICLEPRVIHFFLLFFIKVWSI